MTENSVIGQRPTRVLIVAALYRPENVISAVRIASFADFLRDEGFEVTVLTRKPPVLPANSIAEDVVRVQDPLARVESVVKPQRPEQSGGLTGRLRRVTSTTRFSVIRRRVSARLLWPDRFSFWGAMAIRKSKSVRRPDIILASGPPLSAFFVAQRLARRYGCPWIADYRDLLAFGPYFDGGSINRMLSRLLERRIVRSAVAAVTVSEPMAREIEEVHGTPVRVVMNGFDPTEMPVRGNGDPAKELIISYCGEIYHGKRDPAPLFSALYSLKSEGLAVRVHFYGASSQSVIAGAEAAGVSDLVRSSPRVARSESLRIQTESDVLLLLMWNDPRENGVYSGKLFEYLGARRPVLMLGYEHGVAAELIRERSAGVVANDPGQIADALRSWADQKARGQDLSLPEGVATGLQRSAQTAVLKGLIFDVLPANGPKHSDSTEAQ